MGGHCPKDPARRARWFSAVSLALAALVAAGAVAAAPAGPPGRAGKSGKRAPAAVAAPVESKARPPTTDEASRPAGTGGMFGDRAFLAGDDCKDPIQIESRQLTVDNKARLMTYDGDVKVTRCDVILTSQVLEITYDEQQKINQVCAKGGVSITQGERAAKGEQGCYDEKQNTIVLTGHPQVWQGGDAVSGETIRIFLNEERSIVEGTPAAKVRSIFFPKGKPGPSAPSPAAAPEGSRPGASPKKGGQKRGGGASSALGPSPSHDPIEITSLWLQMDRAASTAIYRGDVEARQKDLLMTSDELNAAFDPKTRLLMDALATGNVKVAQGERIATGNEARYRADPGEIILSGSPVLKEKDRTVQGEKIRYDMKTDQVDVESGEVGGRPSLTIPLGGMSNAPVQLLPLPQRPQPKKQKAEP